MRRRRFHMVLLLALALLCTACERPARVIPQKTFIKIYEEMFVADQWLFNHPELKDKADTTLFYEPLFRKHGFRSQDYHRSIDYYLSRPEQYQRMMQQVHADLEAEHARTRQLIDRQLLQEQNATPLQR